MTVQEYLGNINKRFKTGISREHSYRGDLQTLLESLAIGALATNEPARIKCGAPDFIVTRKDIPVGYVEAKDIGKDLTSKDFKEQFDRYRKSLNNLIFTDYLDFRLYIDGEFTTSVKIAEINHGAIRFLPENYERFAELIKDFSKPRGQTITSPKNLAEMMAGKAKMLAQIIEQALTSDEETNANSTLKDQMRAFLDVLIHDLTTKEFADIYAQTIAYGMFAARLHDQSLETFSRQEAAELIPKSNPFLRKLFQHIAGYDLDTRIKWIVDALADVFRATDVAALLKNFGTATETRDPIIHFYETFLAAYDPKLRKSRGVYYTPEPVVDFIVRAVDDVLKTEFNLRDGLADTSKTTITLDTQTRDSRTASGYKQIEKEVHRVQILDPATGTGTFLAAIVKHIYKQLEGQRGIWNSYVENDLIPRLNGFELLMASYTVAHLKLDMLLTETGYEAKENQRFKIYLTNALEEHHPDTGTLFASWLSHEANEANHIKRDTPVMCVIGNPPYAVSSSNKSEWIQELLTDYKKDLNERKINLDDDYIKFIRFGQHFIDKNGEGVLAYISNNSFIDGITHRQMRKHLLESFDKIYVLDLHGNSKKKETSTDGTLDQNVFDIMSGVSINIFIKTKQKKKNQPAEVFHYDLFGKREHKYNFLATNSFNFIDWQKLNHKEPYFFFVPKNFGEEKQYDKGFLISDLLIENNTGIQTKRDKFVYAFDKNELQQKLEALKNLDVETIRNKYELPEDGRDWAVEWAANDVKNNSGTVVELNYHPFDYRYSFFTGVSKGFMAYPRSPLMNQALKDNLFLLAIRNSRRGNVNNYFISKLMVDKDGVSPFDNCKFFPLYLYPETGAQQTLHQNATRVPNLNADIIEKIAERIGATFVYEKETTPSLRDTPPNLGGEQEEETTQKSSPPFEGGVSEGRGGFETSDTRELKEKINNLPYLKTFRKDLRNNLTPAEAKFWKVVQNKNFEGRKFRRQHSVGNYILDFYCPSEKLAIELDGEVHFNDSAREYDYERKLFLEHYGIKVLRFENKRVFEDLEWMLDVIKSNFGWSKETTPSLRDTPPLEGGELKSFAPVDVLDYIYAVLHSPAYREKYKEFLKIDFPRVPYPKDAATFWQLANLGGELRQIHLLESPAVERFITTYPNSGDNFVTRKMTTASIGFELIDAANQTGKVWINDQQFFDKVPLVAWEFYIGGYQPAQKWLKDRHSRELSVEDIRHYQKIIVALLETNRLMKEIDRIEPK